MRQVSPAPSKGRNAVRLTRLASYGHQYLDTINVYSTPTETDRNRCQAIDQTGVSLSRTLYEYSAVRLYVSSTVQPSGSSGQLQGRKEGETKDERETYRIDQRRRRRAG